MFLCFLVGCILICGSLCGILHASRAGIAQVMYRFTKKFHNKDQALDLGATVRRCEDAQRFYPYNYYFCIWSAEKAYYERMDSQGKERLGHMQLANRWCDAGLSLSPYNSQLRFLKARLLFRESRDEGIRYFEKYVEWNFWNPYNHAFLAELYAEAGQIEKAMATLAWVEGSAYYEPTRRKVRAAWRKELDQLPR